MTQIVQLIVSILLLLSILSSAAAQRGSFRPRALVLPITKDASTLQYITRIKQRTPLVNVSLVIDLGAQNSWVDCETDYISSSYRPVPCRSATCKLPEFSSCGSCFERPRPGCNRRNTCYSSLDNKVIGTAMESELAQDVVLIQSTDGSNPGRTVSVPQFIFVCAPKSLLNGLAKGVKGMAGLGRGRVGMPSLFSAALGVSRKFAICLGSNGVIFFGDGPYRFLPGNMDVSKTLFYTPLIINPLGTAGLSQLGIPSTEYFIKVTSITIDTHVFPFNTTLLNIDSKGNGGTKISTVDPYTVMESSLYQAIIAAYRKELGSAQFVDPVAPFGLCFNSTGRPSSEVGPIVPQIELVLGNVVWYIFGANSMVQVKKDVLCLGIVDGGVNPRTSIVIGAHQIQDNLLQFDLAASRLGFSRSLLAQRTTCSNFNFNFTSTA